VNSHALTLAIRLLGAAAMSAALVSMSGCPFLFSDCGSWGNPRSINLGVSVDLHAAMQLEKWDEMRTYEGVAVGAEGTVVVWGTTRTDAGAASPFTNVSSLGTADLRAIWVESTSWYDVNTLWVVGDAGTAAVSGDGGQTWQVVALPTAANLHSIVGIGSRLVVAGDEVLLVQGPDGTWTEATAPDGGWGQLRALFNHGDRLYAVGLGGVIRSASDPSGEWIAESSGTQSDLFAVGDFHPKFGGTVAAFGAGGTFLVRKSDGWERVDTDMSIDFLAFENSLVLGSDGGVFDIDDRAKLSRIDTFADAKAMSSTYSGVLAVGMNGAVVVIDQLFCEGRPFVVDGRAHVASLHGDDGRDLVDPVAAAWAKDGLYEHASVASFARFALELLALGAPPRLLRDLQAAIADELRHARACFELAQRFSGGAALSPGPLPLPSNAFARIGDPIATALGVFEEACVNESVAACAAAQAAARSQDPEVRRVLEGIATDERRHAVAGWAALRWLLDTYGEQVRQPLQARLARLRPAPLRGFDTSDDALVRNTVLEQLVVPLARSMLFPTRSVERSPS
jgi:photosystem II stability/assembly factor-like uncharacterized protein